MSPAKPPPKKGLPPGAASSLTPGAKVGLSEALQQNQVKAPPAAAFGRMAGVKAAQGAPTAQSKSQIPIEQLVFELPSAKFAVAPPDIFKLFMGQIAPRIRLPKTSHAVLEAFSNIDVTADRLGRVIRSNPYYEHHFLKIVKMLTKAEETSSLNAAVIQYGMQNTRNFLVALQMYRSIKGEHPIFEIGPQNRLNPDTVLRYALETEDTLSGDKSGYADTAYAAGLMFDILAMIGMQVVPDKKKFQNYVDFVYSHGWRTARVGMSLAKLYPDFGYTKYLFGACLVHDIGKVAMAILAPEYLQFVEEGYKKGLPRAARMFAEQKRFGITHNVLSALCCEYFQIFRPVERAIFYHHDPYFLSGTRPIYQLASIICLSTNVANYFRNADRVEDPLVNLWKGPELRDFDIDREELLSVVEEVVRGGSSSRRRAVATRP